ncbi:MAG: cytochrome c peroxidase, partial [Pirellulaceae bacterium]
MAYVSSIWSKAITRISLDADKLENPKIQYLTFSPRETLLLAEDAKLLVSDNFSGRVGVVDTATLKLEHAREFPAHNIRAMRLSHDGEKVIFAHQMLNSLAVTNHNDIHWGLLMSNDLRWLKADNLLDATADFYRESFMQPIGQPNEGGGDPTDVALIPDGQVIVTLGGASEVGIGKEGSYGLHRTTVSGRPMAVTVPAAGNIAYVACATQDAIAVIDLKNVREIERIPLGPIRLLTQVEEGEKLFFDSRLSMEGWMSCHSCHTDGHSSGMANDNLSDGSFGTPKKIISLLGKRNTAPFGWSGSSPTMAAQVRASIDKTMRGDPLEEPQVAALVAYLETLQAPPSIDKLQGTHDQASVERGRLVFLQNNCVACHAPPTYTTPKNYDVGIHDQDGVREFNPPSLRGVGHRQSFFHNAEVDQLEKVFTEEHHQLAEELS